MGVVGVNSCGGFYTIRRNVCTTHIVTILFFVAVGCRRLVRGTLGAVVAGRQYILSCVDADRNRIIFYIFRLALGGLLFGAGGVTCSPNY